MTTGAQETIPGIFHDYGGGVYNVKHLDFGAEGDGVTNDTSAIQAAINAAATAGGGIVLIPEGTYIISQLQMKNGVILQGVGWKTILKQKASSHTEDETGTATSDTPSTLIDSSQVWSVDEHIGKTLSITGGTGSGQVRMITDNGANSLTVGQESGVGSENFSVGLDVTSTYAVLDPKHIITVPAGTRDFIGIRDLKIDGNKANQTALNSGIYLRSASGTDNDKPGFIDNVLIVDTNGSGLWIWGADDGGFEGFRISRVRIDSANRHGVLIDTDLSVAVAYDGIVLDKVESYDSGLSGFITLDDRTRFNNCVSATSGQSSITDQEDGFYISVGAPFCVLNGCIAYANKDAGFHVAGIGTVCTGFLSRGNKDVGIYIQATGLLLTGVVVRSAVGASPNTSTAVDGSTARSGVVLIMLDGNFATEISSNIRGSTKLVGIIHAPDDVGESYFRVPHTSNTGRPFAGNAGLIVFNTDDGNLNIDDGTNWITPDGSTT